MNSLMFSALRLANEARLPTFKNKHGKTAHKKADGSDWSPAQWLQAVVGELGEYAQVRLDYEAGDMSFEEYKVKAAKELADVVTYLDLLALRCLDIASVENSCADALQALIAQLGAFANERKKYDRGDIGQPEFSRLANIHLSSSELWFTRLNGHCLVPATGRGTYRPDPLGINLGDAVFRKFNEVSERVGSPVRLTEDGGVQLKEPL